LKGHKKEGGGNVCGAKGWGGQVWWGGTVDECTNDVTGWGPGERGWGENID